MSECVHKSHNPECLECCDKWLRMESKELNKMLTSQLTSDMGLVDWCYEVDGEERIKRMAVLKATKDREFAITRDIIEARRVEEWKRHNERSR